MKALKTAALATVFLFALFGVIWAIIWGVVELFGTWGLLIFYVAVVFFIFRVCANLDQMRKEDREKESGQ